MQLSSISKIIIKKGEQELRESIGSVIIIPLCRFSKGSRTPPPEGGHGVLHAGPQAEHALQVGLSQELLPVGNELRRAAEQGGHVVHKLWHQAGVGIISLAVVISNNLAKRKRTKKAS